MQLISSHQRVSICISGGFDSSLLLWLLVRDNPQLFIVPHVLEMADSDRNSLSPARAVLDHVSRSLPNSLQPLQVVRVQCDTSEFKTKGDRALLHAILANHADMGLTANYNGITLNPTVDQGQGWFTAETWQQRDLHRDPLPRGMPYDTENLAQGVIWLRPFRNMTKAALKRMYDALGLTDSLGAMTRSCSSERRMLDPNDQPCGRCYYCAERAWAFACS